MTLLFCFLPAFAWAAMPTAGSFTPSSSTSAPNQTITFTTTYSDPAGWQHIQFVRLLINTSTDGANCFYATYNQNTNRLYLRNNANTSWIGVVGCIPGSNYTITNSYAKLNCQQTTVSGVGNTLTIKWSVTFKSTFLGIKNAHLFAQDDSNAYTGLVRKGTWTINSAPQLGTITPASGTSNPDQAVTFTTTYSDPDGWQDIRSAYLLINSALDARNCFYAYYDRYTNKLYLRNNAARSWNAWLGGFAPGSNNTIENSFAKLHCAQTTVSGSGTTLTIKWSVTFKSNFTGVKNCYLFVQDNVNASADWVQKGTWTIQPNISISVGPKIWDVGEVSVNSTATQPQTSKITLTNDGTEQETFELKLINPAGWTAGNSPAQETYVLSGIFCNINDIPLIINFNQDASTEDIITTVAKKATATVFAYNQGTASGVAVPAGAKRALYLQFKSPTITEKKEQQNIPLIISVQMP